MEILNKLFSFMDKNKKYKQKIETLENLLQMLNEKRSNCHERQQLEVELMQIEAFEEECRILNKIIEKGEKRHSRLLSSFNN